MRQLLERWAELEPDRCKLEETESLIAGNPDLEEIYLIDSANRWRMVLSDVLGLDLDEDDFMRIQWTVQAAIVSRGWSFRIGHDSHYGFGFEAEINADLAEGINTQGHSSAAEVLLSAYLKALEAER